MSRHVLDAGTRIFITVGKTRAVVTRPGQPAVVLKVVGGKCVRLQDALSVGLYDAVDAALSE